MGTLRAIRSATWWIGGRRYEGELGVCLLVLHCICIWGLENWDLLFLFSGHLHMLRAAATTTPFCSNPDKLSRPRTRKSRLGRWRKFLLFNACPVFFLFYLFPFCLWIVRRVCVCVYLGYIFHHLATCVIWHYHLFDLNYNNFWLLPCFTISHLNHRLFCVL